MAFFIIIIGLYGWGKGLCCIGGGGGGFLSKVDGVSCNLHYRTY